MRRPPTRARRGVSLLALLALEAGLTFTPVIHNLIRGGLPDTDGQLSAGVSATTTIERDALGVVTIRAGSLADAAFAQGFAHAQDRFFQMDGARRLAAGRLAELVGAAGVGYDRDMRPRLLGDVAEARLRELPGDQRRLLDRYTAGVNAGLDALDAPAPEYVLLGVQPEPWKPADTILVTLSMFDLLSFNESFEYTEGVMRAALPAPLADFLLPETSRFDAPFDAPAGNPLGPAPIPGPEVADTRSPAWPATGGESALAGLFDDPLPLGSNGWVVSGDRSARPGAMLASDMHLPLRVPNVWHRMLIDWGEGWCVGVTLPGAPGVVAGSNSHVAWSFTNIQGDFEDLVRIDLVEGDPSRYATPDGPRAIDVRTERIEVRGGEPIDIEVRDTIWGPIVRTDWTGAPLAHMWIARVEGGVNLALLDVMRATTLGDAIEGVRRWRGPAQNVMIASRDGRLAWVASGLFPKRVGFDGSVPTSWSDGSCSWDGARDESERPVVIDPTSGLIYTANSRPIALERARTIGHTFALGERAARIGERLRAHDGAFSEQELLDIQLDTRTRVLDMGRDLLIEAARAHPAPDERVREAQRLAEAWSGHADADERAQALVQSFSHRIGNAALAPFVARCRAVDPGFRYAWSLRVEAAARLLEERPSHLLDKRYADWEALLVDQLDGTLAELGPEGLGRPWGQANPIRVRHPLSEAVEGFAPLAEFLDMPTTPGDGAYEAVRVQGPRFGASERLVVAPGSEETGILHMPGGQSGHPLSPFYRAGHDAWARGRALPLMPGPSVATLELVPNGQ